MIGYDAGARLDLDDDSAGLFGGIGAGYFQTPEIDQSADAFMDAIPEMVVKSDGDAAEPDSFIIAAADMTARMHGGVGGSDGLDIGEALLDKKSSDVQQALIGYHGNSASVLFYNEEALPSDRNDPVMADDWLTSPDGVGGAILPSRAMEIQQSAFENEGELSFTDLGVAAEENDRRDHVLPEIPGFTGDMSDEYAGLQASDGVEHRDGFNLSSTENLPSGTNRISDGSVDIDHLGRLDDLYARIIAGDNIGDTENSSARTRNGSHIFDDAAIERAMGIGSIVDDDGYGVGQVLPESNNGILNDPDDDAIGRLLTKGLAGNDLSNGDDPGDVDAAMAGFDGRWDRLAGIGAIGKPVWPLMRDGTTGERASTQFPDDVDTVGRAAMNSPAGYSAFVSADRMSDDESMTDHAWLSDMFRNAERVLPKQGIAGRGGENEAAAAVGEEAGTGSIPSLARPLANSADDFHQQLSNTPAGLADFGGRSGPSGHRNDPIYTVAISQATGMLMPMVPTSGTSTRSPPIPGQRNLP